MEHCVVGYILLLSGVYDVTGSDGIVVGITKNNYRYIYIKIMYYINIII